MSCYVLKVTNPKDGINIIIFTLRAISYGVRVGHNLNMEKLRLENPVTKLIYFADLRFH